MRGLGDAGRTTMHELQNGGWQSAVADLYLELNTRLSEPWRAFGIPNRQARDMVAIAGVIIRNHRQNKRTSATDIEQALGIQRNTAQRRMELMAKHEYLARHGSEFWISEKRAQSPLLSATECADISAVIYTANDGLRTLESAQNGQNSN